MEWSTVQALREATTMLETISKGGTYSAMTFLSNLNAIKEALRRAETEPIAPQQPR